MTYARFHLQWTIPWVLLGLICLGHRVIQPSTAAALAITLLFVYGFTVPWDNWAVAKGIWGFPKSRYSFRLGFLPVEEYAFFGLQSLMAVLLITLLELGWPIRSTTIPRLPIPWAAMCLLVWPIGIWLRRLGIWKGTRRWNYARHMFFWMLPILGFQVLAAPDVFLGALPQILAGTLCIGGYLSIADAVAIRRGIWFFDEAQITGHRLGRVLPWEEATFFHLTTCLVLNSFLMFRTLFGEHTPH